MFSRACRDCVPDPRARDFSAWGLLAITALLIALLELRQPLPIDPASTVPFLLACAPLVAIALFYKHVRPRENFALMCITLLQVFLFSALGCVFQYLLAREGGAMWDAHFAAWDRALGLDWLAFVRWVDAHPLLAKALGRAYVALIPEVIAVLLILGFAERLDQLRIFMLAGMLCGAITIMLSPLFPSVSCYVYFGLTQSQFQHASVIPGYLQYADLEALRKGTLHIIRLPQLQGIIAFPSYHAGLATVSLWGFWSARNPWLRWPGVLAAAATIASAPVHGGHYFVDVFAGMAIAVFSIFAAHRLVYWRGASLPLTAWPFRRSRAAFAP